MSAFLVVATPRSATGYTASLLASLGLDCGHERYFKVKTDVSAFLNEPGFVGDCSWMAVPFIDQVPADIPIVHQTRDPLKTIRSLLELRFLNLDSESRPVRTGPRARFTEFAMAHCPEVLGCKTELERAAWFYYHWNRKIDAVADGRRVLRVRVEDLDAKLLRNVMAFIGAELSDDADERLERALGVLPTDVNAKTRDKTPLEGEVTWEVLPPAVVELAESYGYGVESAGHASPSRAGDDREGLGDSTATADLHRAIVDLTSRLRNVELVCRDRAQAGGMSNGDAQFRGATRIALEDVARELENSRGRLDVSVMLRRVRNCIRRYSVDMLAVRPVELLVDITRDFLRQADSQMRREAEEIRSAIAKESAEASEKLESVEARHKAEIANLKRDHALALERLQRERELTISGLQRQNAEELKRTKVSHKESSQKRQVKHDKEIRKLRAELQALRKAHEQAVAALRSVRSRVSRQTDQLELVRAELDLRENEVRYQLGDALVGAWYNPLRVFCLPGRAAKLFFEGVRRARARRLAEREETRLLASDGGAPVTSVVAESRGSGDNGSVTVLEARLDERKPQEKEAPETVKLEFPPAPRPVLPPRLPVKAGVLMDEFTYECFRDECHLTTFTPNDWKEVLSANSPDFLFVESTWRGNDGTWRTMVNRASYDEDHPLPRLIGWCKSQGIPTVFWNKEDPPNFDRFVSAACMCDHIFTSDEDCIPRYRERVGHDRVYALPFAAQPSIHNPINCKAERLGELCFAGTYYREKYPQRRRDIETLLRPAMSRDLRIFDRQHGYTKSNFYKFPKEYEPFIAGGLPYMEMVSAYKAYNIFLNINSVRESPTMFSRRVLELLACGTAVISTASLGVEKLLGRDAVAMVETEEEAAEWMDKLIGDPEFRERMIIRGQRRVFCEHTYEQRLRTILDAIGLDVAAPRRRVSVVTVTNRPALLQSVIDNYQRQAYPDKELIVVLNNDGFSISEVREQLAAVEGARVLQRPESCTLGECLNHAIDNSQFEFVAKFDDDDFYGEDYLTDMVNASLYSGTEVIGKRSYFAYIQGRGCLAVRFPGAEHQHSPLVSGATLFVRRDLFEDVRFPEDVKRGVDTQFQRACTDRGYGIYSADRYNFVANRLNSGNGHTWNISDDEFLEKCQVVAQTDDYRGLVCV